MRKKHQGDYDKEGGDTVRLVTSSHCNRGCTFCSVTQWHKFACGSVTKPLMLSAYRVHALCKRIKAQLPTTKSIYFVEDDFIQDRSRAMTFFRLIINHGPRFRFQVQTHTSHLLLPEGGVDLELFKAMSEAGVEHITMGVENACPHCLKSFNKVQRLSEVPKIIKTCLEYKIRPYILIILFPAVATLPCLETNVQKISQWIEMGATVSCEPNLMAYRGAPLYNSPHEMRYKVFQIDGKRRLRQPVAILPDDPTVRKVQALFNEMWPDYLATQKVKHGFKGATGAYMIKLLKMIIDMAEECWEPPSPLKKEGKWIWNGQEIGVDDK